MKEKLEQLRKTAIEVVQEAVSLTVLQELRVQYLGKKGELTSILRDMGKLSAEERPLIGQVANEVRADLEQQLAERQNHLADTAMKAQLAAEELDVTLPGRQLQMGAVHPLNRIVREVEDIFIGMGFRVAEGPELETDYFNFEALNLPKHHPARDMQDTFYITDELLMRTHTSPVQIRTMQGLKGELPVRIVCPGKVYRRDDDDATHSHMFMQIEGLVIDKGVRMSDLKGTLLQFVKELFGSDTTIRLRPSFFPFTEPSAEVDVTCMLCKGKGCRVCKQTGWLEILGAGMVHPNVLRAGGYNPDEVSAFAFGLGVDRIALLKYGIDDIRHLYTSDLRFLAQYAHL